MDYNLSLKKCKQLTDILKKIQKKNQQPPDADFLQLLRQARTAAQAFQDEDLANQLAAEEERLTNHLAELVERRREALLRAAREANWPWRRFEGYDRLIPFKVEYHTNKVRFKVGSETYKEIQEADGAVLFQRLQEAAAALAQEPFQREEFFRLLRVAYEVVRQASLQTDDWVHIRQLYPTFVLVRQTANQRFMSRPEGKNIQPYSAAQFVYDLSRFGQHGWSCQGYRLETRTPSMREAPQAMILPDLTSVEQMGPQIAHIRILKQEAT